MYFCHHPQIWVDYPQLTPGLLHLQGIQSDVSVADYLPSLFEQARQRLAAASEAQMPEVAAWRQAYRQMGLKPTKYRSAAEALLRRFKRENDLPRLHPLVDLCNAVSLAYALPVAVFDLAHVVDFLEVRYAKGTEKYLAFSGEVKQPAPQEVIFADGANHVHARRWTFRQSLRSVVTPETTDVLIISEAQHETGPADVAALLNTLAEHISHLWPTPRRQIILSATQPRLPLD